MSDEHCHYCKSQFCGCYENFVEPLGGKGKFTVSDEQIAEWSNAGVALVSNGALKKFVPGCINEAPKRPHGTGGFALWEEMVRQAKEKWVNTHLPPDYVEQMRRCYPKEWVDGYLAVFTADEGAGCSDEVEWEEAKGLSSQANHAGQWTDLRFRLPFELPRERREMRRLVSEKLQGVGDAIMAAWEKQYGGE